jgi:two-component system copper resistance phosphate regulon response regulator CusR
MRILVAESDPALGTFLQRGFDAEHYVVDLTADGEAVKRMAQQQNYDAAILDLNLPHLDGLEILRDVRAKQQQLPILILANRTRPEEHAQMLDLGADDLVLKPFAFSELSARVRAILRRGVRVPEAVLRIEDLELSRIDHTVERAGRKIELTPKEFALLEYLMRNAGTRVTRAQIIEHVWNLSFDTMTNVVDVYINYSSAQVDKRRVGQLAIAIQVAFQQMGIFDASNTKPEALTTEPMPFSTVQMVENAPRVQALGRLVNPPKGPLSTVPERPSMDEIQKELEQSLARQIQKHTVTVTPTKEGIVVSLREVGFFDSGSTTLRPDAESTLAGFVKVIAPRRVRIRIEGHTDNVPIHNGRFDSNWELSTSRATEIIKLFIAKYRIAPDRLSASGYGEYYPVSPNDTLDGRATNRRVDLVILNSNADSGPELPSAPAISPTPSPQR